MGTWDEGAFDNDTAADWSHEFDDADHESGMRLIEDVLEQAASTSAQDDLDSEDGVLAVAAAELVAYIAGKPINQTPYNASATTWADREHPAARPPILDLALRALARVTSKNSELADLWDEAETSSWRTSIAELAAKLQSAAAG